MFTKKEKSTAVAVVSQDIIDESEDLMAVRTAVSMVIEDCLKQLKKNIKDKDAMWHKIYEKYNLDSQKNYALNSETGEITLTEDR